MSHAKDEKNADKVDAEFMKTEMKVKQFRMYLECLDLPFHRYVYAIIKIQVHVNIVSNCFHDIQVLGLLFLISITGKHLKPDIFIKNTACSLSTS